MKRIGNAAVLGASLLASSCGGPLQESNGVQEPMQVTSIVVPEVGEKAFSSKEVDEIKKCVRTRCSIEDNDFVICRSGEFTMVRLFASMLPKDKVEECKYGLDSLDHSCIEKLAIDVDFPNADKLSETRERCRRLLINCVAKKEGECEEEIRYRRDEE